MVKRSLSDGSDSHGGGGVVVRGAGGVEVSRAWKNLWTAVMMPRPSDVVVPVSGSSMVSNVVELCVVSMVS
jgi:hypothetical protein